MKIGVAALGETLDAQVSDQFGRCPFFVVVDSESLEFAAFANPGTTMPGGAGPAAVQALTEHGAEAAVAGQYGPKAQQALEAAGLPYKQAGGTVRDAVANWKT